MSKACCVDVHSIIKPLVLRLDAVSRPMLEVEREILAEVSAEVLEIEDVNTENLSVEQLHRVDALMVTAKELGTDIIRSLHSCKVIARMGIGVDKIDVVQATRQGIYVTNLPGFCTGEVADHTMALLLSAARCLKASESWMRQGHRPSINEFPPIRRLTQCILGIVGFGRIGQAVADRARAFGLDIMIYDPAVSSENAAHLKVKKKSLDDLLTHADFIVLVCPLTSESRHMISVRELKLMKSCAILINTGRGGLIDEQALVSALEKKVIRYAALDVFEGIDVLNPNGFFLDHPLFSLENVQLTPHTAAYSIDMIHEQRTRSAREVVQVLQGREPEHPVNPEVVPWFARDSEKGMQI